MVGTVRLLGPSARVQHSVASTQEVLTFPRQVIAVGETGGTVPAVNRQDDQRGAEISGRIAAWSPPGDNLDGTQQAFVRMVVAEAVPRTDKEARTVLSYCGDYVVWLTQSGHALDVGTVFAEEFVSTYRTQALARRPKGTADAICSHLRRLAPGVGLGGTTRKLVQAPAPVVSALAEAPPALSAAVAETITSYRPTRVAEDRWAAVAPMVRQAVTAASPARAQRARSSTEASPRRCPRRRIPGCPRPS